MRPRFLWTVVSRAWLPALSIAALPATSHADSSPAWRAKSREAHQTVWERPQLLTNWINGQTNVLVVTNRYVELATGLNFMDPVTHQWQPSRPAFRLTDQGAVADSTAHQVRLAADISQPAAITLTTPDGQVLHTTPRGLSFFDGAKSVLLGHMHSIFGVLAASNIVIYPDCFLVCKSSLRVVLTRAGLEVDVLLHEQLPGPPSAYGLNEASARFEVLTEFFQSPAPIKTTQIIPPRRDATGQRLGLPLHDDKLQLGAMTTQPGHAFSTENRTTIPPSSLGSSVPVGKSVEMFEGGRQFLIEAVRWQDIRSHFNKLPPCRSKPMPPWGRLVSASAGRSILPPLTVTNSTNTFQIAQSTAKVEPGFLNSPCALVLDYRIVNNTLSGFRFLGRETYPINGPVHLEGGRVTIEAVTVLKYVPGASIHLNQVDCRSTPYSP